MPRAIPTASWTSAPVEPLFAELLGAFARGGPSYPGALGSCAVWLVDSTMLSTRGGYWVATLSSSCSCLGLRSSSHKRGRSWDGSACLPAFAARLALERALRLGGDSAAVEADGLRPDALVAEIGGVDPARIEGDRVAQRSKVGFCFARAPGLAWVDLWPDDRRRSRMWCSSTRIRSFLLAGTSLSVRICSRGSETVGAPTGSRNAHGRGRTLSVTRCPAQTRTRGSSGSILRRAW